MDIFLHIIVCFMLLFLSGFFSGSEAALTSLSKTKIKKITLLKKSLYELFSKWLQYPQGLLTTILVGNTIVNISLSAFVTIVVIQLFQQFNRSVVEFVTWVLVTGCILIFGEILPKIYCRSIPERVAIGVVRPLGILNKLLLPVIRPIMFLVDLIVQSSPEPISKITAITAEEMRTAIIDAGKIGHLTSETTKMLEGALKLTKIRVKEIMIPKENVDAVNLELNHKNTIDKIIETGRSRVPVYQGDKNKITGIIFLKDIADIKIDDKFDISEFIRPVYFVSEDEKVSNLLHEFQKGTIHCAVVIDSRQNLKGFITLEDILEEIVGEMVDEYELAKQKLTRSVIPA